MPRGARKRLRQETDAVIAFLDAADELLAAQQALLWTELPEEVTRLTEIYLERRRAVLDIRGAGARFIGR